MRLFLTGATGLIGGKLVRALLARDDRLVILTRDVDQAREKLGKEPEFVEGNPVEFGDWAEHVSGCDAVLNLAGEHIFSKRWNEVHKIKLRNSRIFTTANLVRAIEQASQRPRTLVSTSAVGYYGDVPSGELDEESPPGDDFMARLCRDWETTALEAERLDVRVVVIRVGVVLASEGGALEQMSKPFKLGVGGPIGSGRQWVSWIHIDDLINIYLRAIDDGKLRGPLNGTGPVPVNNKQFSKSLAAALHRPCLAPVPPFALKLALGEVAQIITTGQRVVPRKLRRTDFRFQHATCDEALAAIYGNSKS